MASVYIETTIPSYLAARPSRDLVTAAHQQVTHEWWPTAKDRFDLYISEAVLKEMRAGDAAEATKRLDIVSDISVLTFNGDIDFLAREYERRIALTGSAVTDLAHFAFGWV